MRNPRPLLRENDTEGRSPLNEPGYEKPGFDLPLPPNPNVDYFVEFETLIILEDNSEIWHYSELPLSSSGDYDVDGGPNIETQRTLNILSHLEQEGTVRSIRKKMRTTMQQWQY